MADDDIQSEIAGIAALPEDPVQLVMPRQVFDQIKAALEDVGLALIPEPPQLANLAKINESYIVMPKKLAKAMEDIMFLLTEVIGKSDD